MLWGLGGGKAPRPVPTLIALALAAGAIALVWTDFLEPWSDQRRWLFRFMIPGIALRDVLLGGVSNAWTLWLGMLVGRRFGGRASAARLAAVAFLAIALVGAAWFWRDRLFPDHAIRVLVMRYAEARQENDYARIIPLLAPRYLHREFGSPPYAPKLRAAFERERKEMGADRSFFCLHGPVKVGAVRGTDMLRAEVAYHYNGADSIEAMTRWTWQMTFEPWHRGWRIADMRLTPTPETTWEALGFEFAQGPGGTVHFFGPPHHWQLRKPAR